MRKLRIEGLGEMAPVVPAPMSGYGDRSWRTISRRMGCELVVVPLISAEGLIRDDAKTHELVDIEREPPPVAVQVFGKNLESLAEATRRVEGLGAQAVDLNLGCPARKVVQNEGGAGLLRNPEGVRRTVAAMRAATSLPLTVKIRAGWDAGSVAPVEFGRIIEGEGANAVTIHARTVRQMYKGRANWDWIAELTSAVAIPVIGNGDIVKGEDAWRMMRETGCDGVMIGRAAMGNPWLFRDALAWVAAEGRPDPPPQPPTIEERLALMRDHAALMAERLGEPRGVILFRKHAVAYVRGLPGAKTLKHALMQCTSLQDLEAAVTEYTTWLDTM